MLMADYQAETALVLAVPHRVLLGDDDGFRDDPQSREVERPKTSEA